MPPRAPSSNLGKISEDYACKFLISKGYKIIARNFRSSFGEIDIVAIDADTLVFVEVKARWSLKFGNPEEAVTREKINKIVKTAAYFSQLHPKLPKKLRIDVVALEINGGHVVSEKIIKVS